MIIGAAACGDEAGSSTDDPAASRWLIAAVAIDGVELDDAGITTTPVLRIGNELISGNTGCSRLTGTVDAMGGGSAGYDVTVDGESCGPDGVEREQAILAALNDGSTITIHGGVFTYGIEDVAEIALFAIDG